VPRKKQILDNQFGDSIKRFRIEKNLTQQMLADKAGISNVQVNKYEKAQSIPKPEIIKRLAKALDQKESTLTEMASASKSSQQIFSSSTIHSAEWVQNLNTLDQDLLSSLANYASFVFLQQRLRKLPPNVISSQAV
jgi:transcriptional regulator with XRE-family HTH domain